MGFRYKVKVADKWYDNTVIFETEKEAQQAADNKLFNWTVAQEVEVVADDRPVNYRLDFETGNVIHIATENLSQRETS